MNALDLDPIPSETCQEGLPSVATLIAGAVATFDVDRIASRRYLMRASAILRARCTHEPRSIALARPRGGLAQWQLNRVVDYIEQHLAEKITGQDLARLVELSVGQLFRAFKISVGTPPLQYVASRRLEIVCSLLRTTRDPLCAIAIAAGYCDQAHLCRVFRRVLGATPAAWRRANFIARQADTGNRVESVTRVARGASPESTAHP
jgi:AraC family transcriptional regulator